MKHFSDQSFGVYVHWPFCAAKCPYCDFNSHVPRGAVDEARFLKAYRSEISYWRGRAACPRAISSVFFGGGTPSLMSPALVEGILQALEAAFGFEETVEISLEANPQSVEAANFKSLAQIGVNRLSIGVQSFDDAALKALGRLHDAKEARAAIETAANHFTRFSFDLIYARPAQSLALWQKELETAFGFGPRHLSLYQLTIEPATPYQKLYEAGKLKMPGQELAADFYELTQALCAEAGLPAYEVSNHAAAGEAARHNLLYWRYGDFLGLGPGAHGRVLTGAGASTPTLARRVATLAERMPQNWLALVEAEGHGVTSFETLDDKTQAVEMVLMGLRLREGISLIALEARTGHSIAADAIREMETAGLAVRSVGPGNDSRIAATDRGLALLNQLCLHLVEGLTKAV